MLAPSVFRNHDPSGVPGPHVFIYTAYTLYGVSDESLSQIRDQIHDPIFFCGTTAQIGPRPSRLGFLDHTQTDTLGRTPLNELSPQETNIHALIGIRNRDPNNRATAKLHLRPHGHRDQIPDFTPRQQCLFQQAPDSKPLQNYGTLNYELIKRGGLENTCVSGRHGSV